MIQRLREEIEQLDVNLIRYNVKKESEEFLKKIKAFSPDESIVSINFKKQSDSTAKNNTNRTNNTRTTSLNNNNNENAGCCLGVS